MEIKAYAEKIKPFWNKFKYAIIILFVGIALLLIPEKREQETKNTVTVKSENQNINLDALTNILRSVDGAGDVKVLLSTALGEETIYQTNKDTTVSTDGNTTKVETVIVTDTQRNETGLITQINPPVYLGAIVVCQGADSPTVRLALTQAVAKITGLGTDNICVLKMK